LPWVNAAASLICIAPALTAPLVALELKQGVVCALATAVSELEAGDCSDWAAAIALHPSGVTEAGDDPAAISATIVLSVASTTARLQTGIVNPPSRSRYLPPPRPGDAR
jgi:hypothetical protein